MKLLLVEAAEYLYPLAGASKANKLLMEWMASKGHQCVVINLTGKHDNFNTKEYIESHRNDENLEVWECEDELVHFRMNEVEDYTIVQVIKAVSVIQNVMKDYQPDLVLVSDDYPFILLETVLEFQRRTVFISHSQTTLPFGPDSFSQDEVKTKLFKKLDGILVVSAFLGEYFKKWAGLDTKLIYFQSYGEGPFNQLGDMDNPYVTMINPSALKGFSIFIEMAKHMKDIQFAVIPTWATSSEEIEIMKQVENITILEPVKNMDDIYRKTKVLLMPSLWGEALGQVVVEALLRGIPVIASKVGGLTEAMLGLDYLLPVNQIKEYQSYENTNMRTLEPIVPEQNWESWVVALRDCLSSREHYMELSNRCYDRANQFYQSLSFQKFEDYFYECLKKEDTGYKGVIKQEKQKKNQERLNALSAAKKEQLAALLRERRGKNERNG